MISIDDVSYGGGYYECPKCGVTVFGSVIHECDEEDLLAFKKANEKKSNKLPTAEEFAKEWIKSLQNNNPSRLSTSELLIDFAKLHVEAALKAASEKAEIEYSSRKDFEINKESILNSYPLDNIK